MQFTGMGKTARKPRPAKPINLDPLETAAIKLEDLLPSMAEFKMNGKVYNLRPINLDDQVWMGDKYGPERLEEILSTLPLKEVCEIIFHQLPLEQKKDFPYEEIEDLDDEGKPCTKEMTGPAKVRQSISGIAHQMELIRALLKTIGISQPVLEKLEAEEIKKNENLTKTQTKNQLK